ncbi:hephaestin-like protein [Mercenaria mercenaria]|uniref:hephaestin-like protein n=1 Tax=Mercenaria mercenaria TaxID=6596 RepID=UPI00234EAAE8|nr:hephaestin-like protein [Mercenaria mercenaria]
MSVGRPIVLLCILVVSTPTSAKDRHYFISADEVEWNYAPSGQNKVTDDQSYPAELIENRSNRIGSTYTKIIYREYTDATFSNLVDVPAWAGFVGPLIKGEIGDTLYIHFRNNAALIQRNFSVHPHGYFYNKGNEGAVYIDGTSGAQALDDDVAPGETFTYIWEGNKLHKPDSNDFHDKCAAFTYHSHVLASRDVDSGLMGVALICNKGTLDANNKRRDVDKELFVYADITDENNSWYIEHNLQKCGNLNECTTHHTNGDDDFAKSNEMAHINGYVYGNLPDFNVCKGTSVVWYFMSVQRGIHTLHINGQTMVIERKRTDTAALHPASVYSGFMTPVNPGRWLLYSRNQDYYVDGMQAFLTVDQCQTNTGVVSRNYYLAIEEIIWNYAPGNVTYPSADVFLENGPERIGSTYKKAMFIEYTDDTFTNPKPREQHWGLAGPPIKTQVNDHVVVKVLNRVNRTFSFLVNGVAITKLNEGAFYKNDPQDSGLSGSLIQPNTDRTYEFDVTEDVGPEAKNDDCITYIYHSAVDLNRDIHTGLFGPFLVCKPRTLATDGSAIGVDKEFFLNWMIIDENLSWFIDDNIATHTSGQPPVNKNDEDFQLSNQMRAINGYTYGTLPGLEMSPGERTVWYMYGLGGQADHHHFSFEGNNFDFDSRHLDTTSVFPGIGQAVTMIPDQTGWLLLRDAQLELEHEGMFAWYNVSGETVSLKAGIPPGQLGITRRYYIGIVTEDWDYCPTKIDPVDGESLLDPEHPGYIFVRNDGPFLGTVYTKVLYKEFTDDTFSIQKNRTTDEEHLGLLGPFIRCSVGDTIEIVLKNFDTTHSYNIVPRNLVFSDGSSITEATSTGPGNMTTYSYFIPERSGPTPDQPNCVGSIYTSRTNALNDPYSGLIGPLVICKRGTLDSSGERTDTVDKEFAAGFIIFNENLSTLKEVNFENVSATNRNDGDFIESNLYHSINGYLYGNQPGIVFNEGDYVAWYIFGFGAVEDIHTVHFHGQLYLRKTTVTTRRDVTELFAGTYETVEMLGYNPGTWLYHCHLAEHPVEGMESAYTVLPSARRRRRSSVTSMRRQKREEHLHNRQQGKLALQ